MASSSQTAPATTATIGSGTASYTSETIVGSHIFKIDGFSATKDLGVGKCIKSSTFCVGGHVWYVECYPCGVDEGNAGWVHLKLCRKEDDPAGPVSAKCEFTLMESIKDGFFKELVAHTSSQLATFTHEDRDSVTGTDFIRWEELEYRLKDDCFHVRCVVIIEKFPATSPPDLANVTVAGSHLLTVDDGYSEIRRAFFTSEFIKSSKFSIGGYSWCLNFYPRGDGSNVSDDDDDDDDDVDVDVDAVEDRVTASLILNDPRANDKVKVRFEVTILTRAGQIISSTLDFGTFSERNDESYNSFLIDMEPEFSPLLQDGIKIKCDVAVVNGITATTNLRRGMGIDLQGCHHVRGDVMFKVGDHLFPAHKCVLTTRCTAFMAEFFGPAGNDNAGLTHHVHVDDMEPRVFEALLHFIYNDTLPEVHEEDKVAMAQGLLVAADRYAMERLKLICADLLCSYIKDARTAITTLNLADKHGCHRLKEACMKFLMDQFANVAP